MQRKNKKRNHGNRKHINGQMGETKQESSDDEEEEEEDGEVRCISVIRARSIENTINDLREMHRGFTITIPDIRPSHYYLWNTFSKQMNISNSLVLRKLTLCKDNRKPFEQHSENKCFHSEHILADGTLCPLSCLYQFVSDMTQVELHKFLYFVTGSVILTHSNSLPIKVELIELEDGETIRYPTATTCVRTISVFLSYRLPRIVPYSPQDGETIPSPTIERTETTVGTTTRNTENASRNNDTTKNNGSISDRDWSLERFKNMLLTSMKEGMEFGTT